MAYSDDARLVARVVAGDERAFEEFIFAYRRLILGMLRHQVGLRTDESDEVFQRFLIHIWEKDFARLRAWKGLSSLSTYLATVARNLGRDFRRAYPVLGDEEIVDVPQIAEASDDERIAALQCAMRELSPRDRELLHRRYELDQSYREIAEAMGITVNTVGVALLRAERRLKTSLEV